MLLVYLAIALVVSFVCSVLEAVLLSITPAFVASREASGSVAGRHLARMKNDIDRPLAAILTLNTFAHTFGAAGVGAQAQEIWDERWLSLVSAVVTVLILIGSEIIPKTLGAVYWRRIADPTVLILRILIITLLPFVWSSQVITRLLRPSGKPGLLSRADIASVAEVGYRDGILRRSERSVIANLLRLADLDVGDIMTPRDNVIAIPADARVDSLTADDAEWYVSRLPVYEDDLDRIRGYVLKDEILSALVAGQGDRRFRQLARPLPRVRADCSLTGLYDLLVQASEHIAWVADADNHLVGIVTMEDLIETVLGVPITDEGDDIVALKQRARARWTKRAGHSGVLRTAPSGMVPRAGDPVDHPSD